MKRFKKEPLIVEAVQFLPEDKESVREIQALGFRIQYSDGLAVIKIQTHKGELTASEGDWIIRPLHGEFTPCKPHLFTQTYQEV